MGDSEPGKKAHAQDETAGGERYRGSTRALVVSTVRWCPGDDWMTPQFLTVSPHRQKATGHAPDGLAAAVCRLVQPSAAVAGRTSTRMATMNAWCMHSCPHNRAGTSGSSATKVYAYNAATGLRNQHTTQTRHQHTPLRACMVRVPISQTDAPARALDATADPRSGPGWRWLVDPASRNRISRKDLTAWQGAHCLCA